jgi:hypothetical protein
MHLVFLYNLHQLNSLVLVRNKHLSPFYTSLNFVLTATS